MVSYLHYAQRTHTIVFVATIKATPVKLPVFPELVDRLFGMKYCNKKEIIFLRSLMELSHGKIK